MRSATMWLGIMGGALMVLLMIRRFNAAILVGILFVTFISWIPTASNEASYFTSDGEIPGGGLGMALPTHALKCPQV
jgi:AGZA family xanthine/uracil permease-like MFS transporter